MAVIKRLEEKGIGGGSHLKEYTETYKRMLHTAPKNVIEKREFVKHWASKQVIVEDDQPSADGRRKVSMEISRIL